MILYDENGSPVSLDLEAVQNAIDTLGSLTENNDIVYEEASAEELAAYYEDYLSLMDADNAIAVAEATEIVTEKNNPLHNNSDMKDVLRSYNNVTRDLNKRIRKALRQDNYAEAEKLYDQVISNIKACQSEIKKMPASVIGNIMPVAIGSMVAIGALVSIPIGKKIASKFPENQAAVAKRAATNRGDFVGGAGIGFALTAAIKGQITMIRQKHKEAMRKANYGEDVSKEMNWCKAQILASYDKALKQTIAKKAEIKKAKSEYKTANVYDDADSIRSRINDINKQLDKNLSYDPKKAGMLKAEKQKLMQKLNSLS